MCSISRTISDASWTNRLKKSFDLLFFPLCWSLETSIYVYIYWPWTLKRDILSYQTSFHNQISRASSTKMCFISRTISDSSWTNNIEENFRTFFLADIITDMYIRTFDVEEENSPFCDCNLNPNQSNIIQKFVFHICNHRRLHLNKRIEENTNDLKNRI